MLKKFRLLFLPYFKGHPIFLISNERSSYYKLFIQKSFEIHYRFWAIRERKFKWPTPYSHISAI